MFLADLMKALRRRWYLALVGVIATAALMAVAYDKAPPTYTSTAEVLLLPPASLVPAGGNPYLSLGGLDAAGDIVATAMSDQTRTSELKAAGAVGQFRVTLDSAAAAPMILVTSEAPSAAGSLTTLGLVVDRIPAVLADVQGLARVPSDALITSTVVTRSAEPVRSLKPVVRVVGLVGAGGLALSVLATALLDAALIRRRASRKPQMKRSEAASHATSEPRPTTTPTASSHAAGQAPTAPEDDSMRESSPTLALNRR